MIGISLALSLGNPALSKGGWSPLSLGSSLLAWWDSSQGLSLSGSQVTAWADRKNAYSMAQGVSAARPLYSATSFGGDPGLTFDGVDDELTLASQPFPSDAEIWVVVQQDALVADTTAKAIFSIGGGLSTSAHRLTRVVSGGVNRAQASVGNGASAVFTTETTVDLSSRHVIRSRIIGGNSRVSVDGSDDAVGAVTASIGTTRARIGASDAGTPGLFFNGKVKHIFLTPPLTDEEAEFPMVWALAERSL